MFTKNEFIILIFIAATALIGGMLNLLGGSPAKTDMAVVKNSFPVKSAQVPQTAEKTQKAPIYIKVNINTADIKEIVQIKGIGPHTAEKILHFRQRHGNFKNVTELMKVKGIGKKKLKKIEPFIEI